MCKLCKTKPVYEFTNQRKICKTCFIHWFQKKVFYTIKKFAMFKKGDTIYYKKGNDYKSKVLEDVLKQFETKAPVKLIDSENKATKIAHGANLDMTSYAIINTMVNRRSFALNQLKPKIGKVVFPIYLFLDKEILLYARLKNLKFTKIKKENNKISNFIEDLEKKHLEIKNAIVSSYLKLF